MHIINNLEGSGSTQVTAESHVTFSKQFRDISSRQDNGYRNQNSVKSRVGCLVSWYHIWGIFLQHSTVLLSKISTVCPVEFGTNLWRTYCIAYRRLRTRLSVSSGWVLIDHESVAELLGLQFFQQFMNLMTLCPSSKMFCCQFFEKIHHYTWLFLLNELQTLVEINGISFIFARITQKASNICFIEGLWTGTSPFYGILVKQMQSCGLCF